MRSTQSNWRSKWVNLRLIKWRDSVQAKTQKRAENPVFVRGTSKRPAIYPTVEAFYLIVDKKVQTRAARSVLEQNSGSKTRIPRTCKANPDEAPRSHQQIPNWKHVCQRWISWNWISQDMRKVHFRKATGGNAWKTGQVYSWQGNGKSTRLGEIDERSINVTSCLLKLLITVYWMMLKKLRGLSSRLESTWKIIGIDRWMSQEPQLES